MALMTREQILGAVDIAFEDLDLSHVPGWGTVRVKDLTAGERDKLEQAIVYERTTTKGGKQVKEQVLRENVRATFCAACIVGEDLQPLFTKQDITALGAKSARALDAIFTLIRKRNGISDGDVAELEGNSEGDQSGDSPTV
jgi:hypothetical protein